MRPVCILAGGITKFAKAHPDKDFRFMVKEAFHAALGDFGKRLTPADIDGSVISYFSDHFTCQIKAGAMVQDFARLCPTPNIRIEGGGGTGGLCFQAAVRAVASGRFNVCAAMGFETIVDTLFMTRLIGIEQPKIGLPVRARFRRKKTWSVNDLYFVPAV